MGKSNNLVKIKEKSGLGRKVILGRETLQL